MLAMMLDPHYKGWGLIIQFVAKERTLKIACEYDYQVLLSLFVYAYNFLNPSDASAWAPNFASQST
jgi:hypothetical protein